MLYESKKKHKWIEQFVKDGPLETCLTELARAADYLQMSLSFWNDFENTLVNLVSFENLNCIFLWYKTQDYFKSDSFLHQIFTEIYFNHPSFIEQAAKLNINI